MLKSSFEFEILKFVGLPNQIFDNFFNLKLFQWNAIQIQFVVWVCQLDTVKPIACSIEQLLADWIQGIHWLATYKSQLSN